MDNIEFFKIGIFLLLSLLLFFFIYLYIKIYNKLSHKHKKYRKIIAIISIFIISILSLNNLFVKAEDNIEEFQNINITRFEELGDRIDIGLTKIEKGISDLEMKENIGDKKEEINILVDKVTELIDKTNDEGKIKDLSLEAMKRIELKLYSSITDSDSIKDEIIENNPTELNESVEAIMDSIKESKGYNIFMKTSNSVENIKTELFKYDEKLQILSSNNIDGINYIKLLISKDSILRQELFEDIDTGIFPDKIKKFEVIKPSYINSESIILGEDLPKLWNISKIGADKYQEKLLKGKKIKVGVIDTGIDYNHKDLKGNFGTNKGFDFVNNDINPMDDHSHGTHVAGTIGASVNGSGIFGVNSNIELIGLKVLNSQGRGSDYDIYEAIVYAANNGIKVINMSIGGPGNPNSIVCVAIDYALSKGTISVVSAGNDDIDAIIKVPAGCKNAITVGAVDSTLTKARFSNYGSKVDISAPGVGIYSTTLNGNYIIKNGTSMATPHVTGLVAAILANQNFGIDELKKLLKDNSDYVKTTYGKPIGNMINMRKVMTSIGITEDGINNNIPSCGSSQHLENNICISNIKTCYIINGIGEQTWNGDWGNCLLKSCNNGYENKNNICVIKVCSSSEHIENNICTSNTKSCNISNGIGEQIWNSNNWGNCIVKSCNNGFEITNNLCIKKEILPTCNSSEHIENNICISNTKSCNISNGIGEQTWNSNNRGNCLLKSCNNGYENLNNICVIKVILPTCSSTQHLENNICVSNTRSCSISNSNGEQTWNSNNRGNCLLKSCNNGYENLNNICVIKVILPTCSSTQHLENNQCVSNTRSCSILNGNGEQTWNNGWGICKVKSCDEGYEEKNGSCEIKKLGFNCGDTIKVGTYNYRTMLGLDGNCWTLDNMNHLGSYSSGDGHVYYTWRDAINNDICGKLGEGWDLPYEKDYDGLINAGATAENYLGGLIYYNSSYVYPGYYYVGSTKTVNFKGDFFLLTNGDILNNHYRYVDVSNKQSNYIVKNNETNLQNGYTIKCIYTNTRSCSISNGNGEQTWNNGWGTCKVKSCDKGYEEKNGSCEIKKLGFNCGDTIKVGTYNYRTMLGLDGNCWTLDNMNHLGSYSSGDGHVYYTWRDAINNDICGKLGEGWDLPYEKDYDGLINAGATAENYLGGLIYYNSSYVYPGYYQVGSFTKSVSLKGQFFLLTNGDILNNYFRIVVVSNKQSNNIVKNNGLSNDLQNGYSVKCIYNM